MEEISIEKRILASNEWGLLALLHEGLMDKFDESKEALEDKDFQLLEEYVDLTKDILTELIIVFKNDSIEDDLGRNLRNIYIYVNKLITQGFLDKNKEYFEQAGQVIEPLLEAFREKEMGEEAKVVSGLTYGNSDLQDYPMESGKSFEV